MSARYRIELTAAEVFALERLLDLAFADMESDRARFRRELRDGSPYQRASAKVSDAYVDVLRAKRTEQKQASSSRSRSLFPSTREIELLRGMLHGLTTDVPPTRDEERMALCDAGYCVGTVRYAKAAAGEDSRDREGRLWDWVLTPAGRDVVGR